VSDGSAARARERQSADHRRSPRLAFAPSEGATVAALVERLRREAPYAGARRLAPAPRDNAERLDRLWRAAPAPLEGRGGGPGARARAWARALDFWVHLLRHGPAPGRDGLAWLLEDWLPSAQHTLGAEAAADHALGELLAGAPRPDVVVLPGVEPGGPRGPGERVVCVSGHDVEADAARVRAATGGLFESAGDGPEAVRAPAAHAPSAAVADDPLAPQVASPAERTAHLVALCGLDGSGKSSLLARLASQGWPGAAFVAKVSRPNVDAVEAAFAGARRPARDPYLRGEFAEAVRWAHAYDFLRYYDEEVRPRLSEYGVVVSDRWSLCSITYAEAGVRLGEHVHQLLACVPTPDLIIYLDVSLEEARRRIRIRGDAKPNEDRSVLEACAAADDAWIPRMTGPVVRIPNVDLEETCRRVEEIVRRVRSEPLLRRRKS